MGRPLTGVHPDEKQPQPKLGPLGQGYSPWRGTSHLLVGYISL